MPRLAQLIRGGIAESVAEALGNPAAWLLACRALKHIPAWALEEPAERSARLAADNERRRGPGRPGQRARDSAGAREPGARGYSAAQPPAGPLGRSYGAVHWAAGGPPAPAHEPGAAQPPDLEQEQLLRQGAADEEWTDPQLERELREIAALWQGHDPALPERVDATRHGVKHYLQLCRQLDPLDVAVLDSNMLPPRYDLSAATLPELIVRVKRVWADLAAGGTPPGDALCDPRSGAPISRELAQRRLAELREVGQ